MEDVGRHNAVDKIAGYMYLNDIPVAGKMFYTTEADQRNGDQVSTDADPDPYFTLRFTAWGGRWRARQGLTLIGRARGKRFVALSGEERIVYDIPMSPPRSRTDITEKCFGRHVTVTLEWQGLVGADCIPNDPLIFENPRQAGVYLRIKSYAGGRIVAYAGQSVSLLARFDQHLPRCWGWHRRCGTR